MKEIQVAYLPIGTGTFHMETAGEMYRRSREALKDILGAGLICPEGGLLSVGELRQYLSGICPDLIILQNLTFANAAYTYEIAQAFPDVPVLIWTLREPAGDGGRLKLNSLTGAFSAANALASLGRKGFSFCLGLPEDPEVREAVRSAADAAAVRKELKETTLAAIGHTPQGFGFGRALDTELLSVFGVRLASIEMRELINAAGAVGDDEVNERRAGLEEEIPGLAAMPEKNIRDFIRLLLAHESYIRDNRIGALASRCWPDYFTDYGTPVCAVLSVLNARGIPSGCEADVYGALSMLIGSRLTGKAAFFGDPVAVDGDGNTITFWHCGMAATSLARKDTGARAGVHPNRKIGPTMEFGCMPSEDATVFRIGRKPDGSFRMFIAEGSIPDMPRQYLGTSLVFRPDSDAEEMIREAVLGGWEPHYAVLYGRCAGALKMLAGMLGLEIWER